MKKSKLIELLSTLGKRELSRFREYVHSPFFNKHEQLSKLADYLLGCAPEFNQQSKLDKRRIYKHLYKNKEYNEGMLHSLFSKLLRLLYNFMVDVQWQEEERKRQQLQKLDNKLRKLRLRMIDERKYDPKKSEQDFLEIKTKFEKLSQISSENEEAMNKAKLELKKLISAWTDHYGDTNNQIIKKEIKPLFDEFISRIQKALKR